MRILDTNICIAFMRGETAVRDALYACSSNEVALTSIVRAELLFGAHHSGRVAENLRAVAKFVGVFRSLAFDDGAAKHYGQTRAHLERHGTPIGNNDLLIASTALAHNAVVITRNVSEFQRVPALQVERW